MSDDIKVDRPEPKLQPMRIVQVPDLPAVAVQPAPGREVTPNNPTGKKLVMSKKELEAAKRAEQKSKPNGNIPFIHTDVVPSYEDIMRNDADRNTKLARNQEHISEIDESWLKEVGGRSVSIAWLQTAVSVSGFVSSETTFSSQKIRGLTMSWTTDGLLCKIDNVSGIKILLVPAANVKCMSL